MTGPGRCAGTAWQSVHMQEMRQAHRGIFQEPDGARYQLADDVTPAIADPDAAAAGGRRLQYHGRSWRRPRGGRRRAVRRPPSPRSTTGSRVWRVLLALPSMARSWSRGVGGVDDVISLHSVLGRHRTIAVLGKNWTGVPHRTGSAGQSALPWATRPFGFRIDASHRVGRRPPWWCPGRAPRTMRFEPVCDCVT